jgi:hypothetical protein
MYDVDEFLVMKKHKTVSELVKDHCRPIHEDCGGLVINWRMMYSDDETSYSPTPVTKRVPYRMPDLDQHVKTIVHVDSYYKPTSPHCFSYVKNRKAYDTTGTGVAAHCPFNLKDTRMTNNDDDDDDDAPVAELYHFQSKSRAEFLQRCERGRADSKKSFCPKWHTTPPTLLYDDSAWQILRENVPAYQWYDEEGGSIYGI